MAPQEEQGQGGGAVQAAVSKAEQLVTIVRTLVLSPGFSGRKTVRVRNKYSYTDTLFDSSLNPWIVNHTLVKIKSHQSQVNSDLYDTEEETK